MSEDTLNEQGILQLVRDFSNVNRKIDVICYPNILRNPFRWLAKKLPVFGGRRERKVERLKERSRTLAIELRGRYDGILYQLFYCAGAAASFADRFPQVWYKIISMPSLRREHRLFSVYLWEVLADYGAGIDLLKPKFMLRQFVDQMPAGEPRAALRLLVYERTISPAEVSVSAARLVKGAYLVLHHQVRQQGLAGDLELLTGGVLSKEVVETFRVPFAQYHNWLFQKC